MAVETFQSWNDGVGVSMTPELLRHLQRDFFARSPRVRGQVFSDQRHLLPYCVQRLKGEPGAPDKWLLLNRDYKPLGVVGRLFAPDGRGCSVFDYVDWESFRDAAVEFRVTPANVPGLWDQTSEDCLFIAGYGEEPASYFARLSQLADLIDRR